MAKILSAINKIECENVEELQGINSELLQKFYIQLSLQPIQFTTAGFYTINLTLLASVSIFISILMKSFDLCFILLKILFFPLGISSFVLKGGFQDFF
jgi:hypothetical protein